jgi:uncharacterized membrane protein
LDARLRETLPAILNRVDDSDANIVGVATREKGRPIVGRREPECASDESRTNLGFRAAYVFDGLSRDSDRANWPDCR